MIISTALSFVLILQATITQEVSIFGYRIFYISTGSMEPTIPTGSLIVVKKEKQPYSIGDVITFYSKERAIYGYPNTHRVIAVQVEGGEPIYMTKGDANLSADEQLVNSTDIIGRMVLQLGTMKGLGSVIAFAGTRWGFLLMILCPLLLITISCMRDFVKEYNKEIRRIAEKIEEQEQGKK